MVPANDYFVMRLTSFLLVGDLLHSACYAWIFHAWAARGNEAFKAIMQIAMHSIVHSAECRPFSLELLFNLLILKNKKYASAWHEACSVLVQ
jgi:hypothetical protein